MSVFFHPRLSKAATLLVAAFVFALPRAARAHDPGLSALEIRAEGARIAVALSLAASDAQIAKDASGTLERFATDSIQLSLDGVRLADAAVRVDDQGAAGSTVTLTFERAAGSRLLVRSDAARRLARGHRQLLTIRAFDRRIVERMLGAQAEAIDIDLGMEPRRSAVARQFFALGLRHILGGYDHLLFLAALLLGVIHLRTVVKTVTAFTVAHSLTLSLAVAGLVHVPAGIVEPLIAASIVWVGIENLTRGQMDSRWKLTFAFGLVHGLGFAGALQDLGVGSGGADVATPLAGFNIGVEAGQIGIAMVLWPLMRQLNARQQLRIRFAPACSLAVVAAGLYWMMERAFL